MTKEEALAALKSRVSARIPTTVLEHAINAQAWDLSAKDLVLDLFEARVGLETLLTFLGNREWTIKDWNDAQRLYLDKVTELAALNSTNMEGSPGAL
jgi:hypothetical protein